MKKLLLITKILFFAGLTFAQSPSSFKYQAVIRDGNNDIVAGQTIGMQMTILQGSNTGTITYQETFSPLTNNFGLINIEIGAGNVVLGTFSSIDWSNGPFFIETAIDISGGTNFSVMGTSQLLSVPYALYAKSSGSSTPGPTGPKGDNGINGSNGSTGPQGETGTTGSQGETGATGTAGSQGEIGATGLQGETGTTGSQGEAGATGTAGAQGETGTNGVAGSNGKTLLSGTISPTTEGVDGDFYINTATNDIYGPKASGTWGSATSIVGSAGSNGTNGDDGKTLLSGPTAPTTEGVDGDFYMNTATNDIYGPKASGAWGSATTLVGTAGSNGTNGDDGKTLLSGPTAPTTEGVDGDFYMNTATNDIYGPKASGAWGSATTLVGTAGSNGTNGTAGKTLLSGTIAPTTEGVDGDFYINAATNDIYGPKASGAWGSATALVGSAGSNGTNGNNGKTLLSGTTAPTTEGVDGDFYMNTVTNDIYGPKASGAWGSATTIVGSAGSNGTNGNDGKTLLSGTIAPTTEGVDGDFYMNTATNDIYGPKASGAWGSATSIVGATGAQGPTGITGGGGLATYRWATFHTYSNALAEWSMQSDPNMHGGVTPANWTDANAIAADMSSDKEVLRTLFQRKGYATKNAMIYNDEWASFSSTNGQVALVLFRVQNTTGSPIDWSPDFLYSCYSAWGERASVALNGVSEMNETAAGAQVLTLTIPANRTSTVIFVSTSTQPTGSPGMRLTRLGFRNNSLDLPAGLEFVDDLGTATGGYEQ